ncbi:MAG: hypothetical protein WCC17_06465 [Candidatus Nitrosopolaris sp.]
MGFKKILDRLGIDIVESNRSWREMFVWSGILKTKKKNQCFLCNKEFADINALANHYRQGHPKEET